MTPISIATAALIMGRTRRTVWRRLADGALRPFGAAAGDRTMISLEDVARDACIRIDPEDFELISGTDAGDAESQCDLALLFLCAKRPEPAIHLLTLAAEQNHAEAQYQLARAHIAGTGVSLNAHTGIMWLARAASQGHTIAREQMLAVQESGTGTDLDAMVEEIEKRVVLEALDDTATRQGTASPPVKPGQAEASF